MTEKSYIKKITDFGDFIEVSFGGPCDGICIDLDKSTVPDAIRMMRETMDPWPSEIAEKKEADWERAKALIVGVLFLAFVIAVTMEFRP